MFPRIYRAHSAQQTRPHTAKLNPAHTGRDSNAHNPTTINKYQLAGNTLSHDGDPPGELCGPRPRNTREPQQAVRELTTLCWPMKNMLVVYRVAPRLTEDRVPCGGYLEPSEPEPSRSTSRNRGYLYPGYPGTRHLLCTEAPRLGNTLIYTPATVPLDSRLSPLQTTD